MTESLSPIRFLSGMRSLFGFVSVELEEKRKKEERQKLRATEARGREFEATTFDAGYKAFVGLVEKQIEAHRMALEKGGADEKDLRTRITELRSVLKLVPDGVAQGIAARKKLEAEKDNG